MKKIILCLLAFVAPAIVFAQTVIVIFVLFAAAACGGMLIWVIDKNATEINMRWLILERHDAHGYTPIETNRVPVAPNRLGEFPAFFIITVTNSNSLKLYRVRLAEDCEIPQGFVPTIRPGAEAQPIIYDPEKLSKILKPTK